MRFLPVVRVTHHHGLTTKRLGRGFNTRWLDQLFLYVDRERGPVEAGFFRGTAAAGFALRTLLYAFQALVPSRNRRAGAKVREMLAYAGFCFFRRNQGR